MSTDPALTLAQWFSPGFPVGAFSYSHGLEWVIAEGELVTADDLRDWIEAILVDGTGRNDAIFIEAAFDAQTPEQLEALNELCLAFCAASGRRIETAEQGVAFARTVSEMGQVDLLGYAYPVAVGRAAQLCHLPLDMVVRFYLHALASNLVSAAVRRIPLGQTEGQRVLYSLHTQIEELSRGVQPRSIDDLFSTLFAGDISAMKQETLYSRMFRT